MRNNFERNWIPEKLKLFSLKWCIHWSTGVIKTMTKFILLEMNFSASKDWLTHFDPRIYTHKHLQINQVTNHEFHCLVSVIENWIQKENLTYDWLLYFPKKNDNAAMMAILLQIFCKRHNQKFISCEISQRRIQFMKRSTYSALNCASIHPPE